MSICTSAMRQEEDNSSTDAETIRTFNELQRLLEYNLRVQLDSVRDPVQRERMKRSVGEYMYKMLNKKCDGASSSSGSSTSSNREPITAPMSLQDAHVGEFAEWMAKELGRANGIETQRSIQRKVVTYLHNLIEKSERSTEVGVNMQSVLQWLRKVDESNHDRDSY